MLLHVLGTAAGGGVPQWNCACRQCQGARAHPERRRRHAALAVRGAAGAWYLVNATPDVREQIEATPPLRPGPGPRQIPLAGVILTDAELDHTLGLAQLRETDALSVIAVPTVIGAVRDRLNLGPALAPYLELTWRTLPVAEPLALDDEVCVQALPVSGKRPRYAADGPADEVWSVALRITDGSSTVVYAPAVADWSSALGQAVAEADCVIVDGTFLDDEEPCRAGFTRRRAAEMGHLPITGPGGTAELLAALPAKHRLYTHLNNTNPLVDPAAPEHARLAELGVGVAREGMVIEL